MLVCDGCDRGFHMHCMGMGKKRPPTGAWFCVQCSTPGAGGSRPAHFFRPPGREGPWRLRYGWCMMVCLFVCIGAGLE
jgi:hypothetical protein